MNEMKGLRCYVLVNACITGIQAGIQAAHAVAELSYWSRTAPYHEWALNDKTLLVKSYRGDLGAKGNDIPVQTIKRCGVLDLPTTTFREPDLGNIVTAVAMICGPDVYEFVDTRACISLTSDPPQIKRLGELSKEDEARLWLRNTFVDARLAK